MSAAIRVTMRLASSIFLLLGMLACGSAAGPGSAIPDQAEFTLAQAADSVPLALGRVVKVGEVFLQLGDVTDSRCPTGVVCVWEGDGAATIAVHPPCYREGCKAASAVLVLHTSLQPDAGTGWGHRVQLVALTPYPVYGRPIDRDRYVAWVRVTRTS